MSGYGFVDGPLREPQSCEDCDVVVPSLCYPCASKRAAEATAEVRAERDRLAAEVELLTAGFQPASDALTDEIAKHAETRRERDRLAAEVTRLAVEGGTT